MERKHDHHEGGARRYRNSLLEILDIFRPVEYPRKHIVGLTTTCDLKQFGDYSEK